MALKVTFSESVEEKDNFMDKYYQEDDYKLQVRSKVLHARCIEISE